MATRKVLQEIPVLPPQTEEQSFVVVPDDEREAPGKQIFSSSTAHAKYISEDESKENILPIEFDEYTTEKSKLKVKDPEKSNAGDFDVISEASDVPLVAPSTPMDFSTVTVDDLGISSESFTNKCPGSGKSPRSLQKYRRRSTIGVRGSPEMNFLIRQIALQRSKRRSDPEPPTSPFLTPRNSMLKDKMSSFRNAFQAVEESEGKLSFPGFPKEDKAPQSEAHDDGRKTIEPPEKRKRWCDPSLPEIQRAPLQPHAPLLTPLQEKNVPQAPVSDKISTVPAVSKSAPPACDTMEVKSTGTKQASDSTKCRKRKVMFAGIPDSPDPNSRASSGSALRPVLKKTPRREDGARSSVSFSLLESPDSGEGLLFKKPVDDSVKKKKQVTFGRELSPELFDKTLPPNTPLRRGSTPYRNPEAATPSSPESGSHSPDQQLLQPDFDCKNEDDLQPLALCFDSEPPGTDDISSSSGNKDSPLKTTECDSKEDISFDPLETALIASPVCDTDLVSETVMAPEHITVLDHSRMTRSVNKSKPSSSVDPPASTSPEKVETSESQVTAKVKPSSRRGRKPVIIKKAQKKAPWGKSKKSRGRNKKPVHKPLYGQREIVSKKPLLSPIPELPESFLTPPASTPHLGKARLKGRVRRVLKSKSIGKVPERAHDANLGLPSDSSDSDVMKTEEAAPSHSEPRKLQDEPLSAESLPIELEKTQNKSRVAGSVTFADIKDTNGIEQIKPLNNSKIRTTKQRRVSKSYAEVENAEMSTSPGSDREEDAEDLKPVTDALCLEDATSMLPVTTGIAVKKRGRPPKGYRRSASYCPIPEPNIEPCDHCSLPSHTENVTVPSEACLPIEEEPKTVMDGLSAEDITSSSTAAVKKRGRPSKGYCRSASYVAIPEPNIEPCEPSALLPHADENITTLTNEVFLPTNENPKPVLNTLPAEDKTSSSTAAAGKKRGRPSKGYRRSASFCANPESNVPFTLLPHTDENVTTLTSEVGLPIDEDLKPGQDALLAEDATFSSKLPETAVKKRGRPSKGYRRSASFCPIVKPNHSSDPSTMVPHTGENIPPLPSDVCLPIDDIFPLEEKKVRRSMRLNSDSGVNGLSWVQEIISNGGNNRRRSVSTVVKFLGSPKHLENLSHSPNKENISGHPVPSAARKVRRRTLCTSTLHETPTRSNVKRRRSTISDKDSAIPSETQTDHIVASLEL